MAARGSSGFETPRRILHGGRRGAALDRRLIAAALALVIACSACAHRYSEDREDWVGPADHDFDLDFAECKQKMDEVPFRFRGDPRLIFLDCMEKRGWYLKGRS